MSPPEAQFEEDERREAPYESLRPIMKEVGAIGSAKDFYWAVNQAFHQFESGKYDQLHADMFAEELMVWRKLLNFTPAGKRSDFLDVGCGTGLVGGFLNCICPTSVRQLTLLDPSPAMLERAKAKCSQWEFPCAFVQGDISSIAAKAQFDVITVNSVLHHIVELEAFCRRATEFLRPAGILLTAQDPRAGACDDPIYLQRMAAGKPQLFVRAARHAQWRLRRIFCRRTDELSFKTSQLLMAQGAITKPMEASLIWAVTDFHVPNQPQGIGKGISIRQLQRWMPDMELLGAYTYDFYGKPWTQQTKREIEESQVLFDRGCEHGRELAMAWQIIRGRIS